MRMPKHLRVFVVNHSGLYMHHCSTIETILTVASFRVFLNWKCRSVFNPDSAFTHRAEKVYRMVRALECSYRTSLKVFPLHVI